MSGQSPNNSVEVEVSGLRADIQRALLGLDKQSDRIEALSKDLQEASKQAFRHGIFFAAIASVAAFLGIAEIVNFKSLQANSTHISEMGILLKTQEASIATFREQTVFTRQQNEQQVSNFNAAVQNLQDKIRNASEKLDQQILDNTRRMEIANAANQLSFDKLQQRQSNLNDEFTQMAQVSLKKFGFIDATSVIIRSVSGKCPQDGFTEIGMVSLSYRFDNPGKLSQYISLEEGVSYPELPNGYKGLRMANLYLCARKL